ncbi:MAG: hypothetical protein QUS14_03740 [Pyrinomonadaceae bacterium]|nr:hypothetical protein [Pyrinomonadaceae bacterium]
MSRIIFSFLVMIAVAVSVFADTIRLKDGSIIKGKITGFSGGRFTITVGDGDRQRTLTFRAEEVASIEFDAQPAVARSTRPTNQSARVVPTASPSRPAASPRVITSDNSVRRSEPQPTSRPSTTVAQNRPVIQPAPKQPAASQPMAKPVELTVAVLADNTANGWTNSGWIVKKGQRIKISGTGEVSLGSGKTTSPSGLYDLEDADKLLKAVPTGALIAVIGDDNNDFIYVGAEREFVAARDGALFLGVNEGNLNDNKGAFNVKIEILSGE